MLAATLTLVLGCKQVRVLNVSDDGTWLPPRISDGLAQAAQSLIPDVPMPEGFVPVRSKCRSEQLPGGRRWVEHLYQGQADLNEAVQFYRNQTPVYGWRTFAESVDRSQAVLWYRKGQELLTIKLVESNGIVGVRIWIADQSASGAAVY